MRHFTDVLRDHRGGKLVDHLSSKLDEVVQAVRRTGKSGELTLKLKITPTKGEDDLVDVVPNCKVTLPEPDLAKALFYVSDEGDLLRSNPNAPGLFQGAAERGELGDKPNAAGVAPK